MTIVDTYDAGGRKTKQTVDGVVTTFTYDNNGNMTVENRGGLRTTYTYDRENRVSLKNDIVRSRAAG